MIFKSYNVRHQKVEQFEDVRWKCNFEKIMTCQDFFGMKTYLKIINVVQTGCLSMHVVQIIIFHGECS